MPKVTLEKQEKIGILRLNNGVTNALSPDLLDDLAEALRTIENDCHGLVLAAGEKFFSMGFDLPTLLTMDRKAMADYFAKFNDLAIGLYTLPMPTCCAISGHAVAGGHILTMTCDYRYAAAGKKLGLNEIKLGVPVPYLADLMLRQLVGDRAATEITYRGDFLTTDEAQPMGLIDDVVAPGDVENRAMETVSQIADFPRAAFAEIKACRVEAIRLAYDRNNQPRNDIFLDCWFSETAQGLIKEASKNF